MLGYTTSSLGHKEVRGGLGGGSGRVLFSDVVQVQVQPAPGTVYASHRDLVVRVEEGRTRRLLQGVGFDSDAR